MKFDDGQTNTARQSILGGGETSPGVTQIPKVLADDKWGKLVNKILATDTESLRDMHRHVMMQNNTDDFLTKLDLIEKYPEIFANIKNKKLDLSKEEIEVLRVMIIEKEGKKFAQKNTAQGKKLMNQKIKKSPTKSLSTNIFHTESSN